MLCPFCSADHDKVIDSRSSDAGRIIRRRRECLACGRRFTTYERIEEMVKLAVVKRDGSRVPYNRQKILAGLEAACYKRPVPVEQLTRAVEEIEEILFKSYDKEVDSRDIGRIASDKLREIDQIAYVRFASIYKQFRAPEDFLEEVREVIEANKLNSRDQGKLF